jgi:hypothetical protein
LIPKGLVEQTSHRLLFRLLLSPANSWLSRFCPSSIERETWFGAKCAYVIVVLFSSPEELAEKVRAVQYIAADELLPVVYSQ